MHYYVANRGRKALLKKIFSVFLIFTLYFNTFNSAFAGAAEKWTIEEVVYNNLGKNLQYTVQKNFGPAANDYKYKATVPVSASALGSTALTMIKYGLASAAVIALVEGVGWIIENGVVKKVDPTTVEPNNPQYVWSYGNAYNTDPDALCKSLIGTQGDGTGSYPKYLGLEFVDANTYNCKVKQFNREIINGTITKIANPKYKPEPNRTLIPVTPDEMGNKVLESPNAPQIVPDIYSPNNPVARPSPAPDATEEILNNAQPLPKDQPLGDVTNKPNKDTNGDGKPDVYDPNLPSQGSEFKLPPFCSFAPTMCEWYAKYKEDSKNNDAHRVKEITFWTKVTDFFDWSKENDSLENEEPEQPQEMELPQFQADAFQATPGCPPDIPIHVSIGTGGNATISYEPICQFAEKWSFVAPLIGFLSGAMILIGVGRKGEDGEI
jgi:hypothetical protein